MPRIQRTPAHPDDPSQAAPLPADHLGQTPDAAATKAHQEKALAATPTRRARSAADKEARRTALVAAALDEFFDRGFAAARMDDIAARAGVTKGTLYLYFKSKEHLFQAIVETSALPYLEQIEDTMAALPSARLALENTFKLMPAILETGPLPKLIKVLVGDGNQFPDMAKSYHDQMISRGLAAVTRLIERGVDLGEFTCPNPALTARILVSPMIFAALWQLVFVPATGKPFDAASHFQEAARLLLAGLGAQEGQNT